MLQIQILILYLSSFKAKHMSYITSITPQLVSEVIKEAKLIKQYATAAEISKLDVFQLDHQDPDYCIYGQMTGNCFNQRANELLHLCAKPFAGNIDPLGDRIILAEKGRNFADPNVVNYMANRYFSAIEVYIGFPDAQLGELIDFIQGKTDCILLKFDND